MDLDYYKNFCEARGKGNYVIDGIFNEEKWNTAKHKILFVLKETVGYSECPIFHMSDEILFWLKHRNKTYSKIADLAIALHEAFSRNKTLTPEEFAGLDFSIEKRFAALSRCAVMELKKHSGVSIISSAKDIKNEFIANRELLQRQMDEIKPEIVVVGSSLCWECLTDKNVGIFRDAPELKSLKKHDCGIYNGKIFYHANHPSAWANGGFDPERIHGQIFAQTDSIAFG